MRPKSRINGLRCILLAGLCWSLVLQAFVLQAVGLEAAVGGAQPVLCHNVGDDEPADNNNNGSGRYHLCCLPGVNTALLSDAAPSISEPAIVAAPPYSFYLARFSVVTPPPRGASRAPPSFA